MVRAPLPWPSRRPKDRGGAADCRHRGGSAAERDLSSNLLWGRSGGYWQQGCCPRAFAVQAGVEERLIRQHLSPAAAPPPGKPGRGWGRGGGMGDALLERKLAFNATGGRTAAPAAERASPAHSSTSGWGPVHDKLDMLSFPCLLGELCLVQTNLLFCIS